MDHSEHLADLDLAPNEASGLLRIGDERMLDPRGWDRGFLTVLDEVDVADCVALLGHRSEEPLDRGWEVVRIAGDREGDDGRADDAEALARKDGWIYVFGSQHGGKEGPIRRREQWVARFREDDARADGGRPDVVGARYHVVRTRFLLHRLINDALRDSGIAVVAMRDETRTAFIERTRDQLAGGPDAERVRGDDWTINVEGAEFAADGALLLGLRFPVAADGRPIVVGVRGVERLFEGGGPPEVTGFWVTDAVGRDGDLAGVRDLCVLDDELHLVTGNLDSKGKGSVILADYPGGRDTVNTHFAASLTPAGGDLAAEAVREFPDRPRIEGIAADGRGRFFYVSDEDEAVHLRCTPLIAGTA